MTIRNRSAVMGLVIAFLLVFYGAAKFNAPYLVEYVVERTLIQKAPPGTDPAVIKDCLEKLLAAAPTRPEKLERLFRISGDLEKVQELSAAALAEILEAESADVFIH